MFKRIRRLEISLAAKCQLLFGAAVVLIIAAALYVPWQRMEQLMDRMNERTAQMLAEKAEADHVARQMEALGAGGAGGRLPATTAASTAASSGPTTAGAFDPRTRTTIRLVKANTDPRRLTRFESRALDYFKDQGDPDPYYRTHEAQDGQTSFRYARALMVKPGASCAQCHAADLSQLPAASEKEGSKRSAQILGLVSIEIPYQADANQVFLNRIFIFLAGLLAGTLAIVVFYLITTRLILGPVRVLQETAEKVSKGDLNIRSDISTGDEFQQLSETFNRMLGNLQGSEDQLRAINQSLDLKIGQLAESNLALYESNRLKSEFLANVSHELRTPLNSILGFAELLKDSPAGADAKVTRYVANILNSGTSLLTLINDLLDLAKIEAGRMELRSEPLSLSDLFEGLTSILKPLAEKKEITLEPQIAREVPIIHTDPARLQQILYNFLSNAIKFSPHGGKIEVEAVRDGEEHVKIAVSDQGPGIDADKHAMIFEKFRQIDGSVTRQHGGSGLGLAISKELTGLLGGSIGVHSTPGQGATFWIRLPLKSPSGPQAIYATVANH